jgi:hypothetical protein
MHGVGPGPAGGGMTIGQPAMTTGGADIGTGTPIILTRGFGAGKLTMPPCAHITLAVVVSRNPGIT